MLPGPAGRSVLVPGWDSGAAIAKEADNDPDFHSIQRTSRTAEARTPALTGPAHCKGWVFHPGLERRGGVLHLTSSSIPGGALGGQERSLVGDQRAASTRGIPPDPV